MTSHIVTLVRSVARIVRQAIQPPAAQPDPLFAFLDGMEIPEHLIGKHFDVVDSEGRVVATTRPQADPRIGGMLG